jgi:hypothetical protein
MGFDFAFDDPDFGPRGGERHTQNLSHLLAERRRAAVLGVLNWQEYLRRSRGHADPVCISRVYGEFCDSDRRRAIATAASDAADVVTIAIDGIPK